ncbi:hypothetical protein ACLRGF_15480 [Mycetocola zhadangensis]|uniref:hypothetical protein n=1 Tax=Mycetocola zhadangensis TaxID=1164595 RepID=UPI003A4D28D7
MTTRSTGESTPHVPRSAFGTLRYGVRRALTMEIGIWASLYRFIFRRPRVPPGAVGLSYHGQVWTILMIFIGLSAVEIPILDLIVHRWPVVRLTILLLGLWGLTWMIGLALGFITRPHSVGPEGIRVRNGAETDVALRWEYIRSVEIARQADEPKSPWLTVRTDGSRLLAMQMQNETNVLIEVERTLTVPLPSGPGLVDAVSIWVDDPRAFLAEVGKHI